MRRTLMCLLVVFFLMFELCPTSMATETYTLTIDIDFIPNVFFSTYDVDLVLNENELVTLPHGEDYTGSFYVEEGSNTIYFYRHGKKKVNGSIELDIKGNMEVSCKLSCYSEQVKPSSITIRTVEDAAETITDLSAQDTEEITKLQAFYDDFIVNGTADNLKDLAKKYGLFVDYRNTGTGDYNYKVACTKDQARVISNSDLGGSGNYIVIKVNIWKDNKIESITFHKDIEDVKPTGDHYDETLRGHGYSESGRIEPEYVGVIGYVAVFGDQEYTIKKANDFQDKSLWEIATYERDKQFWNEKGTLPHKTEVVVREQYLTHNRYDSYTGYLLVEKIDDGTMYFINVKNYITKPYWTYQMDIQTAAETGIFIAEYHQKSDFYPVYGKNRKANLPDGTIVLVTGHSPNTFGTEIEAVWGKSKSRVYFNAADLTIIY